MTNCKIVTYWDGVLHILRNPHGFTEETIREARLAAADRIERLSEVSQVERPAARADDARNWPEDFPHENGNYQRECVDCHQFFIGHKRRCVCKVCHERERPTTPRVERSLENEVLVSVMASLAAAISLLERGGKKAAPSDKMFDQMLADYRGSLERARQFLGSPSQVEQCLRELLDASYNLSAYLLNKKSVMVTEAFAIATENARVLLTKETK